MVVISSQAEPTGANISNEALAFSKLREGLTNRLSPVRVGAEDLSNQTTLTAEERTTAEQQKSDNFVELREFIKGIYSGEGGDSTKIEQETQQENKRIVEAQQDDIPII
jgi:hypothetical protein